MLTACGGKEQAETTKAAEETTAAETEESETSAQDGAIDISEAPVPEAEADNSRSAAANAKLPDTPTPDYADEANWAYLEDDEDFDTDVFFVCPTVFGGDEDIYNMSLDDEESKASFLGATNMEKGIYDDKSRFFAPYYRQAGLNVYELSMEEQEPYLQFAYEDISKAFDYYLEHYNEGRPIILAGFSQGADLCIRLLKDKFADEKLQEQLVACYAIGWRVTEEELEAYPQLKFAEGETDTGVIIAFNSEAENISDSLMIPEGMKSLCINPLNWRTDSTPADKSENLGACFTDYDGNITEEIKGLTGAYIDTERGSLKVPDVTPEDYPAGLYIFEDGIYHLYDYQFFYRNLEENVSTRIAAYLGEASLEDAA
ncbi:MAG TPA: DUF3089 domain-containing protein [Candidatus Avilachnospira avistercoris]|nr:DUF3089 domain-containing protein [Candidatus Avilachnospira avistercoris]